MNDNGHLWDWRRKISTLYAEIRANPNAESAWHKWCETRTALFKTHPQSPIEPEDREGYLGPPVYPYDSALRLVVSLAAANGEKLTVSTGADGVLTMSAFARTQGLAAKLGGELTLYWIEGYGGGVFLPFTDATSGSETYGGGRYLLDTIKGADFGVLDVGSALTLDFNFSYFPSCSYSSRYVCPLAPAGNRLTGAVRAGERSIT